MKEWVQVQKMRGIEKVQTIVDISKAMNLGDLKK